MRELPILFSPEMVRAIRSEQKTETRRVVRPQPPSRSAVLGDPVGSTGAWGYSWYDPYKDGRFVVAGDVWAVRKVDERAANKGLRSPYGTKGDRLWIRSTWAVGESFHDMKPSEITTSPPVWYRSDGEPQGVEGMFKGRWRPSIHMPRWACRDVIEVEEVRVEPLHKIDDKGALAEGIHRPLSSASGVARARFRRLWHSINGKRAPWNSNPWVWVIRFKIFNDLNQAGDVDA